jgi:hypothetical protein
MCSINHDDKIPSVNINNRYGMPCTEIRRVHGDGTKFETSLKETCHDGELLDFYMPYI